MADPRQKEGASHPGRLTLSPRKLALFYPELADADADAGKILAILSDHLWNGDSRAAVVVGTDPLRIAAYADEMDCVLLLGFDGSVAATLSERYQLVPGSRLVTVNSYAPRLHVAADAWEGPGSSGQFATFWPLIADFLSDDVVQVDALRAEIDEHEWQRAYTLGSRVAAWRPPSSDRDGAPLSTERSMLAQLLESAVDG